MTAAVPLGGASADSPCKGRPARLCRLAEIEDGQAKGFVVRLNSGDLDILVARRGRDIFAYVNSCPHAGSPLNWRPDRFMSLDGKLLQCATHGARFRVEDGLCVAGPCTGQSLTKLAVELDGDTVSVRIPGRTSGSG
ncbi:MAG: Rieske (2Fe-2S) protein [Pseudomonadota bacterium]